MVRQAHHRQFPQIIQRSTQMIDLLTIYNQKSIMAFVKGLHFKIPVLFIRFMDIQFEMFGVGFGEQDCFHPLFFFAK